MRIIVLAAAVVFCFCACTQTKEKPKEKKPAAWVAPKEGTPMELTYVPEGWPLGLSVGQGFALHMFDTPSPNQGFKKLPPDTGRKRFYDEFTIAGKKHLVVTEDGQQPLIHFDENRNGDLTDDRGPFPGEKNQLLPNDYSIQIRYDAEKVIAPYRMWLFGSNMGGVNFYPTCHWRGNLDIDGVSYTMVAFDANADGDYSNDPLFIDADSNGKADEREKLKPGEALRVGSREVKLVAVSPSGLTAYLKW